MAKKGEKSEKSKKTDVKKLEKKLLMKRETSWVEVSAAEEKKIMRFAEDYKKALTDWKTEREFANGILEAAKEVGFKSISKAKNAKPGSRLYIENRGKCLALVVVGKKGVLNGIDLVGAHIDSPRLDLKQQPLYEDKESDTALFKTHYYGGIKKYQWVSTPLALHGVIIKKDGKKVDVCIGEDPKDPVFVIGDLLPHLARNVQGNRKLFEGIKGEEMNIIVGNRPLEGTGEGGNIKLAVLDILNKKYGIVEEDLISAELEAVPAGGARDVGLDGSLIGAYGQDDRASSYPAMRAIFDVGIPEKTAMAMFFDKEEIGSSGATGAQSSFLKSVFVELLALEGNKDYISVVKAMRGSRGLSADVEAAVNPTYKQVHDLHNAARLGRGVTFSKYGGARGKSGSSDACAEFVWEVKDIFNKNKVAWQYGSLGKVDEGGGGTIAKYIAQHEIDTIDCGPALVGMHSPFEISSKLDIYNTYLAYKAFMG